MKRATALLFALLCATVSQAITVTCDGQGCGNPTYEILRNDNYPQYFGLKITYNPRLEGWEAVKIVFTGTDGSGNEINETVNLHDTHTGRPYYDTSDIHWYAGQSGNTATVNVSVSYAQYSCYIYVETETTRYGGVGIDTPKDGRDDYKYVLYGNILRIYAKPKSGYKVKGISRDGVAQTVQYIGDVGYVQDYAKSDPRNYYVTFKSATIYGEILCTPSGVIICNPSGEVARGNGL